MQLRNLAERSPYFNAKDPPALQLRHDMMRAKLAGYLERPQVVFNCLSNRMLRPRYVLMKGDEADAERRIALAANEELLAMFERSEEIA